VHGALAEKDGRGVILAGPGDVGKTSASQRLPYPWKSLCDDCTLIVRDKSGIYQAHPWPTWSTFMFGGTGGSWDVQYSVPLTAIFFLAQSEIDIATPLGQGKSTCLLSETSEQAWQGLSFDLDIQLKRAFNLQRFENICDLVKVKPAYLLQFSKNGKFWEEIEKFLYELKS
jgi:SynChlorMet cassette protein ScmC